MHKTLVRGAALLAALAALSACDGPTDVPNYNAQSYEDLNGANLSPAEVRQLTYGILDGYRTAVSANYHTFSGTLSRDVYRLDPSENRYITEFLQVAPDPSAFSGGGVFGPFYRTALAADVLIRNLPTTTDDNLSASEKNAVRGLANTVKALALYNVLELRDTVGIPLEAVPPGGTLSPIVCKTQALAWISTLLDSANTDLGRGGASFGVDLPPGFAGFSTPAAFAKFNRGIKAKVEIARALDHQSPTGATGFTNALTALSQSFLSTTGSLDEGVYLDFSTAGGDIQNYLATDANLHTNPSVADDAQAGDQRLARKVEARAPLTLFGFTATEDFTLYDDPEDRIPVLRNEELILLRAQAEIGLGQLEAARADLNVVRTRSGGLAAYATPFATATDAITALLYEKRYSLLLEGAQRLTDLRAYNRLNATYVRAEGANDPFIAALPIPTNEVNARGGASNAVCTATP